MMKRVLFVQLPPPRFRFEEPPTNIPLAAGFLVSALRASTEPGFQSSVLDPAVADFLADEGLAARIMGQQPDVVAMTLYVWNSQRSLFLASNLKRRLPGLRVIVGGPEVTPDNQWILEHPAVDAGVFGEGESRIAPMMELMLGASKSQPPGTFRKARGKLLINDDTPQPWDLAAAPYPYLDRGISPSWDGTLFLETVRGCPFQCRYCYYHKTFAGVRKHPAQSIRSVLDMTYSQQSGVRELYLMDPTFNAIRGFRTLLKELRKYRPQKDVALHTELRADLLTRQDVELLKDAGLRSAEVGLQSINRDALREAGRTGDPEKVARGVEFLKQGGIEVITGIILGLPKDSPEGFAATLAWLKKTGAYSVVHPFVLSILPGTNFRTRASMLGLTYEPRPPYYVRSTPTFTQESIQASLLQCEEVFDMEMDHIPLPSLVDHGPEVIGRPDRADYISKWILDPSEEPSWRPLLDAVISRASDPFTFWFRGSSSHRAEEAMVKILSQFCSGNPHAVLHVVAEFPEPPRSSFFRKALEVSADPGLFINRSYAPLVGEGEVVSVNFTLIVSDPGDPDRRERIADEYARFGTVVWNVTSPPRGGIADLPLPVLISWPISEDRQAQAELFEELLRLAGDSADEILFRLSSLQHAWERYVLGREPASRLEERILAYCKIQSHPSLPHCLIEDPPWTN
ncbi:MAG: radical SAM protein [Thermodesulfobacteriota bacterium]